MADYRLSAVKIKSLVIVPGKYEPNKFVHVYCL